MRQTDLADAIGMSPATLSRIETNRRPARPGEILRLAIQLGCTVEDLFLPPDPVPKTGWERRPIELLNTRAFEDLAASGALPEDHTAYD